MFGQASLPLDLVSDKLGGWENLGLISRTSALRPIKAWYLYLFEAAYGKRPSLNRRILVLGQRYHDAELLSESFFLILCFEGGQADWRDVRT